MSDFFRRIIQFAQPSILDSQAEMVKNSPDSWNVLKPYETAI